MSLGVTPDNVVPVIIATLAALPVCLLLLGVGGLLRHLLGIQSTILGFFVVALPLVGTLVGASLYLDQVGVIAPAQVLKKTETIQLRKEGDWRHHYQVQVQYTAPDRTAPAASFNTTAAVFDALHEGGNTAVRTVSINGWFNLVRLAGESTWTWLPWNWLAIGLGVILLGWLGWRYFQNKTGCALLILVALAIFVTPFVWKFIEWRNSANLSLMPLRASGVITQIERVTEIDPLPGDGSGGDWETRIQTTQPYDIVVVRYTPRGYEEPILGVDAIDAGSQVISPEMSVEIAYAPTDPRSVRLLQGERSHHWKNPVEWLRQQALAALLVVILMGGVYGVERWWRRLLRRRTALGT
ncbi:MAG: hypothetical protein DYG89_29605 [Caldilinea sp. CFX5]|nr:hypothetical protein [Caldilinea sp. CFX5]